MRAVKSVSIDSERRVIITFLDGSTETLYPNLICCDAEALKEIIKELLEEKANAIVQTINDVAVATFADGADEALIRKLLVSIDPIQEGSGDPSPENIRPISGRSGLSVTRCGKNLLPGHTASGSSDGVTWTVEQDGSVVVNGTASSTIVINAPFGNWKWDGITNCWLSGCPDGGSISTYGLRVGGLSNGAYSATSYDSSGVLLSNAGSVNLVNIHISFQIVIRSGTVCNNLTFSPQLEYGSAKSNYEPYKGSTYSVNWETGVGTVYGGTLDVVSGELTVDRASVDLGTMQLIEYANYPGLFFKNNFSNGTAVIPSSNRILPDAICSTYKPSASVSIGAEGHTKGEFALATPDRLYISNDDYAGNTREFNESLSGQTLVYKLISPTVILLTPQEVTTLLGTNNIWADSGDILELEYVADTKLYIGESQSGTLGSGRQTISNTDLQPVSEKTVEDLTEAVKTETAEKETHEETEDERGE